MFLQQYLHGTNELIRKSPQLERLQYASKVFIERQDIESLTESSKLITSNSQ